MNMKAVSHRDSHFYFADLDILITICMYTCAQCMMNQISDDKTELNPLVMVVRASPMPQDQSGGHQSVEHANVDDTSERLHARQEL